MHWANLRAASCCWALLVGPMNPGGSRFLHALMACWNDTEFGSSDEPFTTPSMVSWPDASGSGNWLTPLARMHWENFTACARLAAVLLPPLLPAPVAAGVPPLLPVPVAAVPVAEGAFEHAALIRATMARATSGCRFLLMFSPR